MSKTTSLAFELLLGRDLRPRDFLALDHVFGMGRLFVLTSLASESEDLRVLVRAAHGRILVGFWFELTSLESDSTELRLKFDTLAAISVGILLVGFELTSFESDSAELGLKFNALAAISVGILLVGNWFDTPPLIWSTSSKHALKPFAFTLSTTTSKNAVEPMFLDTRGNSEWYPSSKCVVLSRATPTSRRDKFAWSINVKTMLPLVRSKGISNAWHQRGAVGFEHAGVRVLDKSSLLSSTRQ